MLISIPSVSRRLVKAYLVNWTPWFELRISGRAFASPIMACKGLSLVLNFLMESCGLQGKKLRQVVFLTRGSEKNVYMVDQIYLKDDPQPISLKIIPKSSII